MTGERARLFGLGAPPASLNLRQEYSVRLQVLLQRVSSRAKFPGLQSWRSIRAALHPLDCAHDCAIPLHPTLAAAVTCAAHHAGARCCTSCLRPPLPSCVLAACAQGM